MEHILTPETLWETSTLNAYAQDQIEALLAVCEAEQSPLRWYQAHVTDPIADRLLSAIWPQGIGEE